MSDYVYIFETTLRDGEQSPGASMNLDEKMKIAHALVELDWMLLGYWSMTLAATAEFAKCRIPVSEMSAAKVIRAFRHTARDYIHPIEAENTLPQQLRRSRKDNYQRKKPKASRNYPRRRKHKPVKPAVISKATKQQKAAAKRLRKPSLAA